MCALAEAIEVNFIDGIWGEGNKIRNCIAMIASRKLSDATYVFSFKNESSILPKTPLVMPTVC